MTGSVYQNLQKYQTTVLNELTLARYGTATHGGTAQSTDTQSLLAELSTSINKAEPQAIDFMKTTIDDNKSNVLKVHLAVEECERFLKDVDLLRRAVLT